LKVNSDFVQNIIIDGISEVKFKKIFQINFERLTFEHANWIYDRPSHSPLIEVYIKPGLKMRIFEKFGMTKLQHQ